MPLLLPLLIALAVPAAPATQPQAAPAGPVAAPVPSPAAGPKARGPKAPPTTLDVVVQDARGRPVAGALVSIAVGRGFLPQTLSARTDAEGRVTLDGLSRPPWDLSVQAKGLAPKKVERVTSSGKPLVVRLEPGASVTGVVRDAATREPVAGARVWAWVGLSVAADRWDPDAGRVATTSDARGRFTLDGFGAGTFTVTATARGRGRATRQAVRPGARVELYLLPGASIAGVVRDEAGRPVKGAVLRALTESPGGRYLAPAERTDTRGAYELAGLEPGAYVVVARAATLAPGLQAVSLEADGDAAVDFTLVEGGFATGRLVDSSPKPTRGGRVRLATVDGVALPMLIQDLAQSEAGTDGRFTLGPLPPGELVLQASAPGFAERDVETRLAGRPLAADLGDVTLDSGLVVRGSVRDRSGSGIAGAHLFAMSRSQGRPVETTSADDGTFALAGLAPGTVEIGARATGYASASQTATVGGNDVVLVLDAGGTIVGAVVDAKGQPVDGAFVRAELEADRSRRMYAPPGGVADEGGGRFTLRDAQPGRYVLVATASGHAAGNVSGVRVAAGSTTDAGTIRLGSGGTIQGTVANASGEPVAGATVRVEAGSSSSMPAFTQTDGSGAFELAGVPPGRVDLSARHPAYAPARVSGVVVEAECAPAEARLVMTRGGRVEGAVRLRGGQPFAGARVMVSPRRAAPGPILGGGLAPTPVADDGSFAVDHVAAGPSLLSVLAPASAGPGGSGLQAVLERELEVRDGETSLVDVQTREVLVTGRVTRRGEPVAGLTVSFRAQRAGFVSYYGGGGFGTRAPVVTGPQPLFGTTGPDGGYELLVLEPGRYSVMQRSPDGAMSPLTRSGNPFVEVPDVPAHQVDFAIGGATLAGVVVEEGGERSVPSAFVSFSGKGTRGGGMSDASGRFSIDVEPGEGQLSVQADGFARSEKALTVGEGGLDSVRVELARGLEISGRVVDASGRTLGDLELVARSESGASSYGRVLPDGSFRLRGLSEGAHALAAGSDRTGYGLEPGVAAGATGVVVTVRPGSRVSVRVVDPAGRPVAKAMARIDSLGGVPAFFPGRTGGLTDTAGMLELVAPEGLVGLVATLDNRRGHAAVECRGGAPAAVELVLSETVPPR